MRPIRHAFAASFGRRRTLSVLSLLIVLSFASGFATDFWLPLRLGYLLLLGLAASAAWSWIGARGVRVGVRLFSDRLQVGQTLVELVEVANRSRIPKLWLEVEEITDMPQHRGRFVVSLGGGGRRSWRVETVCRRRGLYGLGSVAVRTGDPFGLFRRERRFGAARKVVVYPKALNLPHYTVPPATLPGEGRFRRRTHYVTPNASGLREYAPGDSVNRIHWPSTLRANRLMVKTFDLDPGSDFWVILDLSPGDQAGRGDESTVEYGVTAAASVARLFLAQSRSVGLLMFGSGLQRIEAARGAGQMNRILEALALAQAVGDVPLSTLLNQQGQLWGRHSALVVITAATQRRWVEALRSLTQRGVRAAVILLDPESFGGRQSSDEIATALLAGNVQVHRLRQGESLPAVLAPRGTVGGAARAPEVVA